MLYVDTSVLPRARNSPVSLALYGAARSVRYIERGEWEETRDDERALDLGYEKKDRGMRESGTRDMRFIVQCFEKI